MFCPSCGSETPDNVNFCPNCGKDLKKEKILLEKKPIQPIQGTPMTTSGASRNDTLIAVAIIGSVIGMILIIAGIPTIFRSPPTGATMIVIGLIIISITSRGRCFYCFYPCAGCGDCDCDCDC